MGPAGHRLRDRSRLRSRGLLVAGTPRRSRQPLRGPGYGVAHGSLRRVAQSRGTQLSVEPAAMKPRPPLVGVPWDAMKPRPPLPPNNRPYWALVARRGWSGLHEEMLRQDRGGLGFSPGRGSLWPCGVGSPLGAARPGVGELPSLGEHVAVNERQPGAGARITVSPRPRGECASPLRGSRRAVRGRRPAGTAVCAASVARRVGPKADQGARRPPEPRPPRFRRSFGLSTRRR